MAEPLIHTSRHTKAKIKERAGPQSLTPPENKRQKPENTREIYVWKKAFLFRRGDTNEIPWPWNVGKLTISFPHKFLQTSCYPVSVPENANFNGIGSKHPNSLWHDHGPPWHKIIGFSQIRLRLTLGMMQIEWLHDETKQRSMQSWEYNRLQTSPISDLQVDVLS